MIPISYFQFCWHIAVGSIPGCSFALRLFNRAETVRIFYTNDVEYTELTKILSVLICGTSMSSFSLQDFNTPLPIGWLQSALLSTKLYPKESCRNFYERSFLCTWRNSLAAHQHFVKSDVFNPFNPVTKTISVFLEAGTGYFTLFSKYLFCIEGLGPI
jgi:hypothetical protein